MEWGQISLDCAGKMYNKKNRDYQLVLLWFHCWNQFRNWILDIYRDFAIPIPIPIHLHDGTSSTVESILGLEPIPI